ncbi:hypothetical protein B9Z19DRAFT_1063118 [Tuber borchii]|uniref:VWFA domain-containing protein n=1 Tax=Tuber borchii TaxID=42251 RepID=A0A2T6ZZA7_TUBBO|nr:hypothetical protein B9Z19DRAFT_1063118 [Tuber borchii]
MSNSSPSPFTSSHNIIRRPGYEMPTAVPLARGRAGAGSGPSGAPPEGEVPCGKEIGERLKDLVINRRNGLKNMYGETEEELNKSLEAPIKRGEEMARKLSTEMGCSREVATDLAVLTLYYVAILISDSQSMINEENGARKQTLIQFVDHITEICSMVSGSGILAMRFMNRGGDHHSYGGATRIGTELKKKKILDKFAIGNPNQSKPLLVLIITDGGVEGEKRGHLKNVIRDCVNEREGAGKGFDAVAFQFSRIGNDSGAAQLLTDLDGDRDIREYVDVLPVKFDPECLLADKWFVQFANNREQWGEEEMMDHLSDSGKYAEYTDPGDDWAE